MPPTRGISCLSLVLYGIRIGVVVSQTGRNSNLLAVADSAPDCAGLRGPQSTAGEGALSTGGPGEAGCTSLYPELRNESAGDDLRPQGVH